ncbi:MAG TPA: hypothetical protein VM869_03500 [Enhygromyxa sp.]|nr:hypothetical protein [Enhygromyxa sp.]
MTPPPRSLRFAVGTSLLSASLSLALAGCTEKSRKESSDAPDKKPPVEEEDHINVGPEEPPVEPVHVNEGPEPQPKPEAAPQPIHVNEGPQEPPEPEPGPPEPKRVNTRPTLE